jgi:CHASE2 domain-containing sensor protein
MLKKILAAPLVQILLLTALVLAGMVWPATLFEHIENMHFDFWSARFRAPDDSSVAILAIDQESIDRFGDWPWPRSRTTEMVRLLTEARAGAQGIDLLYSQPDADPGLAEIQAIRDQVTAPQWKGKEQNTRKLLDLLAGVETRLNQDAQLAEAIRRARNTVLPIRFTPGISAGDDDTKLSGLLIVNSTKAPQVEPEHLNRWLAEGRSLDGGDGPVPAGGIQTTFEELAGKAGGLGHINVQTDRDGVVRRLPLLKAYRGRLFPSMALQLAIKKIHGRLKFQPTAPTGCCWTTTPNGPGIEPTPFAVWSTAAWVPRFSATASCW